MFLVSKETTTIVTRGGTIPLRRSTASQQHQPPNGTSISGTRCGAASAYGDLPWRPIGRLLADLEAETPQTARDRQTHQSELVERHARFG
jgi:hypothetical protein